MKKQATGCTGGGHRWPIIVLGSVQVWNSAHAGRRTVGADEGWVSGDVRQRPQPVRYLAGRNPMRVWSSYDHMTSILILVRNSEYEKPL
eukprot:scaffold375979_cov14-Prasinocladus_malaysianus.AAC.1